MGEDLRKVEDPGPGCQISRAVVGEVELRSLTGEYMTKEQRREQQIEAIARWIINSKRIVAFTGAGISTDSGIPDFRGPN